MTSPFLQSAGGKLAEQWTTGLVRPAFLFWGGGAAAWIWRYGVGSLRQDIGRLSASEQFAFAAGGLVVVMLSAAAAEAVRAPVLRFLEGYWMGPLRPLRAWLTERGNRRADRLEERFQRVAAAGNDPEQYADLDIRLRRIPPRPQERMPTRLGNILRASERWPSDKYGLDAVICWPRLWLALPDGVRKELTESRSELDAAVVAWLWSVAFLIWAWWAWWAALVSLAGAAASYVRLLSAAAVYADLIESAFDVYRGELYRLLRMELPTNIEEEREAGRRLTQSLWRGSEGTGRVVKAR